MDLDCGVISSPGWCVTLKASPGVCVTLTYRQEGWHSGRELRLAATVESKVLQRSVYTISSLLPRVPCDSEAVFCALRHRRCIRAELAACETRQPASTPGTLQLQIVRWQRETTVNACLGRSFSASSAARWKAETVHLTHLSLKSFGIDHQQLCAGPFLGLEGKSPAHTTGKYFTWTVVRHPRSPDASMSDLRHLVP